MKAKLVELIEKTQLEPLNEVVLDKINRFYQEVVKVNQVMNLTTLVDEESFAEKHILDTLFIMNYIKGYKLLDLGSGLGVPGLVVQLINNGFDMTLIDALNKRVTYLNNTIKLLDLSNTLAVHGRFEMIGKLPKYRECFDTVLARAVADLPVLLEYSLPFVKQGGSFLAMKGKNALKELDNSQKALEILGGQVDEIIDYTLPSGDERHLIIVKKVLSTPLNYPRKSQHIQKKPLI